ncbi:MAG: hypothetical protein OIF32_08810, partial [Campylobacterales bacterium]|nr:hypothetical protein [Campylobacterales bacterium]
MADAGIVFHLPKSEKELLKTARSVFRPMYNRYSNGNKEADRALEKSLSKDSFRGVVDFLTKDLSVNSYEDYWISDGCLNMMFTLEEAPDPTQTFSAFEADDFLTFGVTKGQNQIPYFGVYSVSWSPYTKKEGDQIFKLKSIMARAMTSNSSGYSETKIENRELQ